LHPRSSLRGQPLRLRLGAGRQAGARGIPAARGSRELPLAVLQGREKGLPRPGSADVDSRLLQVPVPAAREVSAVSRKGAARALLFLLPLMAALSVRALRAFGTHGVLDWDETYYLSLANTAASGGGLYPYIYGFGPMHVMGGVGYAAYAYALAVRMFGPTIFALRAVSLIVAVLGVWGIWVAVRTWYGSAAAWIAAALTASLRLFVLSNTARMDTWAFAWAAWRIA